MTVFPFFFFVVFFLGKNTNYMDDLCLGYLLQGMCYRCVNKPKEAMESLLNTVNRSVTLLPATCLLVSFFLLIFVMDLESERVKTTGLFYMIRETPFRVWEQKTSARKLWQMSVSSWERSRGKDSGHPRPALTAHFFPLVCFWRDILSASFPNQGVQAPYSSFFVLQIKGPS